MRRRSGLGARWLRLGGLLVACGTGCTGPAGEQEPGEVLLDDLSVSSDAGAGEGDGQAGQADEPTPSGTSVDAGPADPDREEGDATGGGPAPEEGGAPMPSRPPRTMDLDLSAEFFGRVSHALQATAPDGDALTYRIVDQPAHGTIEDFDPSSGEFTYRSTAADQGSDEFTFQVNDGGSDAPQLGTVRVSLTPVNFTGNYTLTDVTNNGAGCSEASFRILHLPDSLEVSRHQYDCSNDTFTMDRVFASIEGDRLFIDGSVAGSISATGFEYAQSRLVSGCGRVEATFSLERGAAGMAFDETNVVPCFGVGSNDFDATVRYVPTSELQFEQELHDFGRLTAGEVAETTLRVSNIGKVTATGLRSEIEEPFRFKGGAYPGTGGTCGAELPAGQQCGVVVEAASDVPSEPKSIGRSLRLFHDDGTQEKWVYVNMRVIFDIQLTEARGLAVGNRMQCVLDADALHCWGENTNGALDVPELGSVELVSAGRTHVCAVSSGIPHCWGDPEIDHGESDPPADLTDVTAISAGWLGTCALSSGSAVCWGNMSEPPELTNPTQISVGYRFACALDDEGVQCWGQNNHGQTDVPALSNPREVAAGNKHACAITDHGVECWGSGQWFVLNVPELTNPRGLSVGAIHSCVLTDDGPVCWGRDHEGQTDVPELNAPTAVVAGYDRTCALDADTVRCWGR